MKQIILALIVTFFVASAFSQSPGLSFYQGRKKITIQPIQHASFILTTAGTTIYVDPTGTAENYKNMKDPDIILISDIHGDHFDLKALQFLKKPGTTLIAPKAVADGLPADLKTNLIILNNGETTRFSKINITAIPMYNLPETVDSRHPKGRGNGYILKSRGKRVYISGDTEDISEMRELKDIDIAFVCMNLPYTMDINQASSAVLEFKPKNIIPYHYRGQDVQAFKNIVNKSNPKINVILSKWYTTN